ncbi:MAG: glutathione S-transferase family protein [Parvibaculaceae bacterium]
MYTLYNVKRWGSMGPHFLLEELGVPYQSAWMTPEQVREPDFRDLSPLGYIPVLKLDDGHAIFESAAIVSFLTTAHADKGMAPMPGTGDHGTYLAWLSFLSANIYSAINLTFEAQGFSESPEMAAVIKGKAVKHVNDLFDIVEKRLEKAGPFLLGEEMSAVDLYLFMLTIWAEPSERALHERCPKIRALAEAVRERPKLRAILEVHGVDKVPDA